MLSFLSVGLLRCYDASSGGQIGSFAVKVRLAAFQNDVPGVSDARTLVFSNHMTRRHIQ
jgi:hypothetical protein